MSYAARATSYARSVAAGEIEACRWVRLAAEKHLGDLERQADDSFGFRFDEEKANKVCGFLELLPHVKGRWARDAELLRLEDWQCFLVAVPFGWVRKATGMRRYRRAYIEVPRKNAKSTLTAGLGLYMVCEDGEHGAEVYSGAGTEKQAWEVFGPAKLMAKKTPSLCSYYGLTVNAKNLSILGRASKFEPIIGKPGDGASPSFSITDEYHEHATADQYDTMVTGMGARDQPMAWVITTAGADTAGPCYNLRSEVQNMLEGKAENDELWGLIYTVDDDDDWSDPATLRKANPNMGVSVSEDFLLARQKEAVGNPWKQSTFKTKHLNVWVTAASPFFNAEKWRRLADPSLHPAQFAGEPCWIGLDLASKLDLCSKVKVFARDIDGAEHLFVFGTHYIPLERTQEPGQERYAGWVAGGHVVATPGNITDYDEIEDDVRADAELHRIASLGFDPWNATQVVTHLMQDGIECEEVSQSTKYLSQPMKQLQALIEAGRVHHTGDPVLAWAIGNVTAQEDRNDNVFPRKERKANKIDPAVATIIAIGQQMNAEGAESEAYVYGGL